MPAVGDLRNRLMALAGETEHGQQDVNRLFTTRLSATATPEALEREFGDLVQGCHPLTKALVPPMRSLVLAQLRAFDAQR